MKPTRYATGLTLFYLLIAGGYILISGRIAAALAHDVAELERIEHLKGTAFVLVTGVLLWVTSWLLFARLKRSEEEHQAERRALMLVQSKVYAAELAATVAHDFNNVLLVLRAGVDELDCADPSANPQSVLTEMRRALDSARDLTKRMARAARGSREVNLHPASLGELVSDTIGLMRRLPRMLGRQIELRVASSARSLLDPVLVEQIVVNLLLNAADAVGDEGTIRVEVDEDADAVSLSIHDDGRGLTDKELKELLLPFNSTKPDGLGLGLLSVRASVEASRGQLVIARSPLGGAHFEVRWPKTSLATTEVTRSVA
ncbi:MAG: HAMP domain-containing sensor histidine kinase [Polyangiaceae bacterium]